MSSSSSLFHHPSNGYTSSLKWAITPMWRSSITDKVESREGNGQRKTVWGQVWDTRWVHINLPELKLIRWTQDFQHHINWTIVQENKELEINPWTPQSCGIHDAHGAWLSSIDFASCSMKQVGASGGWAANMQLWEKIRNSELSSCSEHTQRSLCT